VSGAEVVDGGVVVSVDGFGSGLEIPLEVDGKSC
jgi:hypothetical protein